MIEINDKVVAVRKLASLLFETEDDFCKRLLKIDLSNLENIVFPKGYQGIYRRIYYLVEFYNSVIVNRNTCVRTS